MLLGSQLSPWLLGVLEDPVALESRPHPSSRQGQARLCSLIQGGLLFQGVLQLLPILLGLAPPEALGFGGSHPDLQAVQVHLWNLWGQEALVDLAIQVNPFLQVSPEDPVVPVVLGLPSVLSGHLVHHILGSLCVLGDLVGLEGQVAPANHSPLGPPAEAQLSQGGLEPLEVLLDHRGREAPDLQVDPGQEQHHQELFLLLLQGQVAPISLGGRGAPFLQKDLEEKFLDFLGLLVLLSALVTPLDRVGPPQAALQHL